MLRRSGVQALKALLALAADPQRWQSVRCIAAAQQLPEPMLEQLLLQLRRAGLVEARRGRLGGYRLGRDPERIAAAEVLAAVGASLQLETDRSEQQAAGAVAEQKVLDSMRRRLQAALDRELAALTLQELLFDLQSWQESLSNEGGLMLG